MLWTCKTCPWSCPVRHLLMFIRIVGHSSGHFFMSHENIVEVGADPDEDNGVSDQISHTTFLADLQYFTSLFIKGMQA